MKHLVIGLGQVGTALQEVLGCPGHDPHKRVYSDAIFPDVIHICFGYFEGFDAEVKRYQKLFKAKYTVIHSTVPIGTSRRLGALHSPIRGRHPDLAESIKTFTKYVAGPESDVIVKEFHKLGVSAHALVFPEDTEAGKLLDLMQFGAMILLEKEIWDFCQRHNVNFDVAYTNFNRTYNDGYGRMGFEDFRRPILEHMPGPIGGHCVSQMMEILDSPTAQKIVVENNKLRQEHARPARLEAADPVADH